MRRPSQGSPGRFVLLDIPVSGLQLARSSALARGAGLRMGGNAQGRTPKGEVAVTEIFRIELRAQRRKRAAENGFPVPGVALPTLRLNARRRLPLEARDGETIGAQSPTRQNVGTIVGIFIFLVFLSM
jgi:hypothetical protein